MRPLQCVVHSPSAPGDSTEKVYHVDDGSAGACRLRITSTPSSSSGMTKAVRMSTSRSLTPSKACPDVSQICRKASMARER